MRSSPLALLPLLAAACEFPMPPSDTGAPSELTAAEVDCATITADAEIDAEVDIVDLAFDPAEVTVPDGGIVRWTNRDTVDHTVTSGAPDAEAAGALFDSGVLAPGDEYCLQVEGTGSAAYFCEIHPMEMRDATVTIGPPDGEEAGLQPAPTPAER